MDDINANRRAAAPPGAGLAAPLASRAGRRPALKGPSPGIAPPDGAGAE